MQVQMRRSHSDGSAATHPPDAAEVPPPPRQRAERLSAAARAELAALVVPATEIAPPPPSLRRTVQSAVDPEATSGAAGSLLDAEHAAAAAARSSSVMERLREAQGAGATSGVEAAAQRASLNSARRRMERLQHTAPPRSPLEMMLAPYVVMEDKARRARRADGSSVSSHILLDGCLGGIVDLGSGGEAAATHAELEAAIITMLDRKLPCAVSEQRTPIYNFFLDLDIHAPWDAPGLRPSSRDPGAVRVQTAYLRMWLDPIISVLRQHYAGAGWGEEEARRRCMALVALPPTAPIEYKRSPNAPADAVASLRHAVIGIHVVFPNLAVTVNEAREMVWALWQYLDSNAAGVALAAHHASPVAKAVEEEVDMSVHNENGLRMPYTHKAKECEQCLAAASAARSVHEGSGGGTPPARGNGGQRDRDRKRGRAASSGGRGGDDRQGRGQVAHWSGLSIERTPVAALWGAKPPVLNDPHQRLAKAGAMPVLASKCANPACVRGHVYLQRVYLPRAVFGGDGRLWREQTTAYTATTSAGVDPRVVALRWSRIRRLGATAVTPGWARLEGMPALRPDIQLLRNPASALHPADPPAPRPAVARLTSPSYSVDLKGVAARSHVRLAVRPPPHAAVAAAMAALRAWAPESLRVSGGGVPVVPYADCKPAIAVWLPTAGELRVYLAGRGSNWCPHAAGFHGCPAHMWARWRLPRRTAASGGGWLQCTCRNSFKKRVGSSGMLSCPEWASSQRHADMELTPELREALAALAAAYPSPTTTAASVATKQSGASGGPRLARAASFMSAASEAASTPASDAADDSSTLLGGSSSEPPAPRTTPSSTLASIQAAAAAASARKPAAAPVKAPPLYGTQGRRRRSSATSTAAAGGTCGDTSQAQVQAQAQSKPPAAATVRVQAPLQAPMPSVARRRRA